MISWRNSSCMDQNRAVSKVGKRTYAKLCGENPLVKIFDQSKSIFNLFSQ